MSTCLLPINTCLLPPQSCADGCLIGTAAMSPKDVSSASSICSLSSRRSSDWRQPLLPLLVRRQWVLMRLPSGLYLRTINGRQVEWTEHPGLAFGWLSTEPVQAMVKADPELFGDSRQLQAVELTYVADRQPPYDWICHA
jgi:hypothetical protein